MSGGRFEERLLILDRPYLVYSGMVVDAAAALARIDRDLAAVLRPGKDGRKHGPGVISSPKGTQGEFVAPVHEYAAGAAIGQCLDRHVAEFKFDLFDVGDIVAARLIPQPEKVLTAPVFLQQP